jgi:hypothetical protein
MFKWLGKLLEPGEKVNLKYLTDRALLKVSSESEDVKELAEHLGPKCLPIIWQIFYHDGKYVGYSYPAFKVRQALDAIARYGGDEDFEKLRGIAPIMAKAYLEDRNYLKDNLAKLIKLIEVLQDTSYSDPGQWLDVLQRVLVQRPNPELEQALVTAIGKAGWQPANAMQASVFCLGGGQSDYRLSSKAEVNQLIELIPAKQNFSDGRHDDRALKLLNQAGFDPVDVLIEIVRDNRVGWWSLRPGCSPRWMP